MEKSRTASTSLTFLTLLALAGLAGIILISRSKGGKKISIDALRRAYSGLHPEEMEEMKYI